MRDHLYKVMVTYFFILGKQKLLFFFVNIKQKTYFEVHT